MNRENIQVDPQHVINSLTRQSAEQAQKIAVLEALIEMQNEASIESLNEADKTNE